MLAASGLALAAYLSHNRNQVILNPYVKSALPLYRSLRDFLNSVVDAAYVFQMRRDVGIPQYRLEVKTSDLRKLNEALPSSLSDEVITGALFFNEDIKATVPGTFYYQDAAYDVKVSYRGLSANHWTRPKKSWQIRFSKKTPFEGLRALKLIIPEDRGYLAEPLNNYRAQKLGLVVPGAQFVQLYVNNDYYGVYFGIEDFSSEFLEKSNKPADANIYAAEDFLVDEGTTIFDGTRFWRKESEDKLFDYENFSELDFLLSQMREPNFLDRADDIVDLENFYRWNIIGLLAGSDHQSNAGNVRLYFNNAKGKFELIPWDVWDGGRQGNPELRPSNTLAETILSKGEFYRRRNQLLWDYVNNEDNLKDDLAYYDALYVQVKGAFYSDFKKHENNLTFNRKVADIRVQYESMFNRTKELFSHDRVDVDIRHDASNKIITLEFAVDSFAGITLNDVVLPDGALATSGVRQGYLHNPNETATVRYSGSIGDISKIKLALSNAVTGEPVKINSIQIADISTFTMFSDISATMEEFLAKNPMFRRRGDGIILPAGTYMFVNDVIIPKNLATRIEAGVTAYFGPGASLVSYSPVAVAGSAARPVVFRRINPSEPWGSFAVQSAGDATSSIAYLDADGGKDDYINGVFYIGMVSFYYSDVNVRNATISRSEGDDGMNIKYADVSVSASTFRNNAADGLDVDYVTGNMQGNTFTDNGNDGIDISGSRVLVKDNNINGSGDKCISIGERAVGTAVVTTTMDSCNIGIEVKDDSYVPVVNSTITNNTIGISAYLKKPIYKSGGMVHLYGTAVEQNATELQKDEYSEIRDHGDERIDIGQL